MLDPEAKALLDAVKAANRPEYADLGAEGARKLYKDTRGAVTPPAPEVSEIDNIAAPGPHGPIPLRYYRPAGVDKKEPLPALVFYHGGGWVIGDLDTHDVACRTLANEARCAVISVDYRMGPEHKFPCAVDDAYAALLWTAEEARRLRIDPAADFVRQDMTVTATILTGRRDRIHTVKQKDGVLASGPAAPQETACASSS